MVGKDGVIVDEKTWAIRYIIVNTSNWWLGHKVVISPEWIDDVDWPESKLSIDLTRQAIKDSPPYEPNTSLSREQETRIHAHYGRTGYWPGESKRSSVQPDCSHPQYAAVDRRKLEHAWQVAVTGENRSYRNGICPFETCYPGMASALRPR